MRPPPRYIEILLPVWGARYTGDFLDLCLPSLLAPGNVPALSELGSSTFVLLAPARNARTIEASPLWALLRGCCAVRVQYIEDLVSLSSSTVLTLAYASAIREAGERALDTCFVPLVADYVVSDGSLFAVVQRVFAGASGVLAGNFQVAREIAYPWLNERKNDAGVLAVRSRALVEFSLKALHRTTLTDIVNDGQSLKAEINRLFWRVDDCCMVGRFFLMHMIAIRPETLDFVIAAASDYSFIPEFCPSGNIVHMTDSDDYFVVECQPEQVAIPTLASGSIEPRAVAKAIAAWATANHLDNLRHRLVFRAGASSPGLFDAIAASENFILEVKANSSPSCMPFRHHPVWKRSLDYHLTTARTEQDLTRVAAITGDRSLSDGLGLASRLRSILLGRAPYFRPWHPRWPDVRALRHIVAATGGSVAIVSNASARVRAWLETIANGHGGRITMDIRLEDLADWSSAGAGPPATQVDCLLLIADRVPAELIEMLARIAPLVKPNGAIVLALGPIFSESEEESGLLSGEFGAAVACLSPENMTYVTKGAWREAVQTAMMRYARRSVSPLSLAAVCGSIAAGGLAAISVLLNIAATQRQKAIHGSRSLWSSLFLTLRKAAS